MSPVKGVGNCLIPKANGQLCSGQIAEGEPISTAVVGNTPLVGHKACVDAFTARQKEKQDMVKRVDQQGAGGPVDMSKATDAIMGSIPLEKPAESPAEPLPDLSEVPMPEGVRPVSEVPFEGERQQAGRVLVKRVEPAAPSPDWRQQWHQDNALRKEIDDRFTYHPATNDQAQQYAHIREQGRAYAHLLLDECPQSYERREALRHLDAVVMYANAAIARHTHE